MKFKLFLTESKIGDLILRNAITIFGTNIRPGGHGYILPNGYFIEMNESEDHREINQAFFPDPDQYPNLKEIDLPKDFPQHPGSGSIRMLAFMFYTNSVRYSIVNGRELIMSFVGRMTNQQKKVITEIISGGRIDYVKIDKLTPDYHVIKSYKGSPHDEEILNLL